MQQADIAKLLTSYGFKGLVLTKMEGTTYTYKFSDYNYNALLKNFGKPSVASAGKVAVFIVPSVGRMGVSPSASMVRLVYSGSHKTLDVMDTHLAKIPLTPELSLMYERAKSNTSYRVKFATKLWEYFNDTKFDGRLPKPKILVSVKPPASSANLTKARGVYFPRLGGPAGTIWLADYLFNSREAFFVEVHLHEICHQAVACIDRTFDPVEGGHGPLWKSWMRKVGLDPRRYDPTDDVAYSDPTAAAKKEEQYEEVYGPRKPASFFKKLTLVKDIYNQEVIFEQHGRALKGKFAKTRGGISFTFKGPRGGLTTLVCKSYPETVYQ